MFGNVWGVGSHINGHASTNKRPPLWLVWAGILGWPELVGLAWVGLGWPASGKLAYPGLAQAVL